MDFAWIRCLPVFFAMSKKDAVGWESLPAIHTVRPGIEGAVEGTGLCRLLEQHEFSVRDSVKRNVDMGALRDDQPCTSRLFDEDPSFGSRELLKSAVHDREESRCGDRGFAPLTKVIGR